MISTDSKKRAARAANRKAVEQLGWRPKAVDMLTDIRSGSYQAIAEKLRAETAVR